MTARAVRPVSLVEPPRWLSASGYNRSNGFSDQPALFRQAVTHIITSCDAASVVERMKTVLNLHSATPRALQ